MYSSSKSPLTLPSPPGPGGQVQQPRLPAAGRPPESRRRHRAGGAEPAGVEEGGGRQGGPRRPGQGQAGRHLAGDLKNVH